MKASEKTREGRDVWPQDARIRRVMEDYSGTLCAKCKHVADLCETVSRVAHKADGYVCVSECEGFESTTEATAPSPETAVVKESLITDHE